MYKEKTQNLSWTLQIHFNVNYFLLLTKSHSGDASTTIFGPESFTCVKGDPAVSSSGMTENRPRWRNGEPCGIKRKRPTDVSGGGATVTLKRPRDSDSDSIFLYFHLAHLWKNIFHLILLILLISVQRKFDSICLHEAFNRNHLQRESFQLILSITLETTFFPLTFRWKTFACFFIV